MLLQFSVKNYRSIRDKVEFSMLAADDIARLPGDTVHVPGVGNVLRVAAIYGPNASGKTTLLDALDEFATHAAFGRQPAASRTEDLSWFEPFRLDPQLAVQPTEWEVVVFAGSRVWTYALAIDSERVTHESLKVGLDDDAESVFVRTSTGKAADVKWGKGLSFGRQRKQFLGFVAEGCRPEQPLLAELRSRNAREVDALVAWLEGVSLFGADEDPDGAVARSAGSDSFLAYVGDFLAENDLSIDEVALRTRRGAAPPSTYGAAYRAVLDGDVWLEFRPKGSTVYLSQDDLSDGTLRLLALASDWSDLDGADPIVVLVDELDRSLHTAVSRRLVDAARRRPGQGQLIFTTHDTNLLDPDLLAPDCVWFVDKDDHGVSSLYSLAEFKAGQVADIATDLELGYLQGRFGAIPRLSRNLGLLAGEP